MKNSTCPTFWDPEPKLTSAAPLFKNYWSISGPRLKRSLRTAQSGSALEWQKPSSKPERRTPRRGTSLMSSRCPWNSKRSFPLPRIPMGPLRVMVRPQRSESQRRRWRKPCMWVCQMTAEQSGTSIALRPQRRGSKRPMAFTMFRRKGRRWKRQGAQISWLICRRRPNVASQQRDSARRGRQTGTRRVAASQGRHGSR